MGFVVCGAAWDLKNARDALRPCTVGEDLQHTSLRSLADSQGNTNTPSCCVDVKEARTAAPAVLQQWRRRQQQVQYSRHEEGVRGAPKNTSFIMQLAKTYYVHLSLSAFVRGLTGQCKDALLLCGCE